MRPPQLYPYQVEGRKFLVSKKVALLGDEMGLGKTPQAVRAIDCLRLKGDKDPALIICPAIARTNWQREIDKWSVSQKDSVAVFKASDLSHWFVDRPKDHLIISYEFAHKLLLLLPEPPTKVFSAVVMDEIHYLKNKAAKRTQSILGNKGLVRFGGRVWGLSGTLMPNHAGELWTLLFTFGVTKLNFRQFVERYCDSYGGYVEAGSGYSPLVIVGTKRKMIPELREMLHKIVLRRTTSTAGLQLPPIRFGSITLTKPKELPADLLEAFDLESLQVEEERVKAYLSAEALALMAPSVSTLRRYNGLMKVEAVAKLVAEELRNKEYLKLVIFCIHQGVVRGLEKRLWEFSPVSLYGDTPQSRRQINIDRFQNDLDCQLLIANIGAAGTAINLTAASHMLFVELDWTPGNNAQAIKRCHRIGQDQSVYVRTVGLENSIDDRITQILARKTEDIALTFGEGAS